jgi:glyoxylase-like metal-dependent hydrolase (beta-lactamase superfamily II)
MPRGLNRSSRQAIDSLQKIEPLDVTLILPGHGAPWNEGARAAVAAARAAGVS